jgi:predicted DNA-binding protein (UPF0278 family)
MFNRNKAKIDVSSIKKINIEADDVIVYQMECKNLPAHVRTKYNEQIRDALKDVFPNNKVLIIPKEVDLTILSKKDLQD